MQKRVIAVCGKGGVGKTAFTTLLTKVITEDQSAGKLLVVDADPALGLHYALGRGSIKTIGTVRDEILRVAEEGNRQAQEELADRVDNGPHGLQRMLLLCERSFKRRDRISDR